MHRHATHFTSLRRPRSAAVPGHARWSEPCRGCEPVRARTAVAADSPRECQLSRRRPQWQLPLLLDHVRGQRDVLSLRASRYVLLERRRQGSWVGILAHQLDVFPENAWMRTGTRCIARACLAALRPGCLVITQWHPVACGCSPVAWLCGGVAFGVASSGLCCPPDAPVGCPGFGSACCTSEKCVSSAGSAPCPAPAAAAALGWPCSIAARVPPAGLCAARREAAVRWASLATAQSTVRIRESRIGCAARVRIAHLTQRVLRCARRHAKMPQALRRAVAVLHPQCITSTKNKNKSSGVDPAGTRVLECL